MFTICIHILEVLAMKTYGTNIDFIIEMGSTFEYKDIRKGLTMLEKEGYITSEQGVFGRDYFIAEKAIEYCETIVRKRERAIEESVGCEDSLEANVKTSLETSQEGDGDVNIETQVITIDEEGHVSFNLYGNLTIGEVIETYEMNANIKVSKATLDGDMITLKFEHIPHDDLIDDPDTDTGPYSWNGDYCSNCNCPHSSCSCGYY